MSEMFRKVRDAVVEETGNVQVPFTYGSRSSEDVYLAGLHPAPSGLTDAEDGGVSGAGGAEIQMPGEAKGAFNTKLIQGRHRRTRGCGKAGSGSCVLGAGEGQREPGRHRDIPGCIFRRRVHVAGTHPITTADR